MNLIVFDIDGTLTDTNEVDSRCFIKAVEEVSQVKIINTDWSSYQYSTDSGLLKEIYQHLLHKEPTHQEVQTIQQCFLENLKQEWTSDKTAYMPIPGAHEIFHKIAALSSWHVAIATGGWRQSALFKLAAAAIPYLTVPKAFADDHQERTEIIKIAIQRAQTLHQCDGYQRKVYVGDRMWDACAAQQLNMEFIGVGSEFINYSSHSSSYDMAIENFQKSADLLAFLQES